MLTLNLISQEIKKEIKLKRVYGLIKKTNYSFVIAAIIFAAVLLFAKFILQNNFNEIVAQTTLVTKNSQAYNNKVRGINSQLALAAQIQNDFTAWSVLLEELAAKTPAEVNFSYVKIDKMAETIKIRGRVRSRDALLVFKNNLENSAAFTDIDFPVKNILKQKDIDFEISAKLDLDKIE